MAFFAQYKRLYGRFKKIFAGDVAPFIKESLFSATPKCSANIARTAALARPCSAGAFVQISNASGALVSNRFFFSPA